MTGKKTAGKSRTRKIVTKLLNLIPGCYPNKISNYRIYREYLKGKRGLEIGGPSGLFKKKGLLPVYPVVADLDGCNFSNETVWEGVIQGGRTYHYNKYKKKGHQYISDAVDLGAIESEKYDFILSCHNIEHIANPFRALHEWLRVLKDDGILLLVVPHKDGTFDHNRPVTAFGHLVEDYENDIKEDDMTHLQEILDLHDYELTPEIESFEFFRKRSLENFENRCLHHHVFDTELVVKVFDHLNLKILSADIALPHHIMVIGQKQKGGKSPDNSRFTGRHAEYRLSSSFESDRA